MHGKELDTPLHLYLYTTQCAMTSNIITIKTVTTFAEILATAEVNSLLPTVLYYMLSTGFSPKRHTVALRPPSRFGRPLSNSKAPCFKVPAPQFFDLQKDLNVHARYTSSGKTVAMGTWHAFIRK